MKEAISLTEAVKMIPAKASLLIGGFLGIGSPHRVIAELVRQKRSGFTIIANDTARLEEITRAALFILLNDYYDGRILEIDGGLRL